MINYNHNGAV